MDNPGLVNSAAWLVLQFITNVLQIANRLNTVVSSIGRKPLKVLLQVNTSGEECKLTRFELQLSQICGWRCMLEAHSVLPPGFLSVLGFLYVFFVIKCLSTMLPYICSLCPCLVSRFGLDI